MPTDLPNPDLNGPGLVRLSGHNFSGRSEMLRRAAKFDRPTAGRSIYVGSDVHAHLSSFMPTVREELDFFATGSAAEPLVRTLFQRFGLDRSGDQSPFHRALSGGQEALLVLLCRLALQPELLACDGCLEPLSQGNKRAFIAAAASGDFGPLTLLVADNREEDFIAAKTIVLPSPGHTPLLEASAWQPAAVDAPELVVDDVTFGYDRDRPVLRGANARFRGGKIYGLVGDNGSGKSTLARILCSIISPIRGAVLADNHPLTRQTRYCAYHFQDADLQLFETSVRREIAAGAPTSSEELVRAFGLQEHLEHHPFDLPPVLRKRLAMAATFAQGMPWLIIDEPTLGQDARTCAQLAEMLRRFACAGGGVIVISHSENFLRLLNAVRTEIIAGEVRQ